MNAVFRRLAWLYTIGLFLGGIGVGILGGSNGPVRSTARINHGVNYHPVSPKVGEGYCWPTAGRPVYDSTTCPMMRTMGADGNWCVYYNPNYPLTKAWMPDDTWNTCHIGESYNP